MGEDKVKTTVAIPRKTVNNISHLYICLHCNILLSAKGKKLNNQKLLIFAYNNCVYIYAHLFIYFERITLLATLI